MIRDYIKSKRDPQRAVLGVTVEIEPMYYAVLTLSCGHVVKRSNGLRSKWFKTAGCRMCAFEARKKAEEE